MCAFVSHVSAGKSGALGNCVMNEFENWTKRNSLRYSHCLDDKTKMAVFRSAVANNMVAFDLIVKTYGLNYEGNSHFVELVRQFVQQKKYKEVDLSFQLLSFVSFLCLSVILLTF